MEVGNLLFLHCMLALEYMYVLVNSGLGHTRYKHTIGTYVILLVPGVRNSVVFIQSGSGQDHNRVSSAKCGKGGCKINHPLLAECACVNIGNAHCIQLKWVINFRARFAAVC